MAGISVEIAIDRKTGIVKKVYKIRCTHWRYDSICSTNQRLDYGYRGT